jgi:hypothetical protein
MLTHLVFTDIAAHLQLTPLSPRQRRTFAAHPLGLHDITAFLRYSPVHPCDHLLCLTDTTAHLRSTHLSHRHHRAFAVHSVRFHDIAVHLWFTCFVSSTSLHICGSPIRLTDIAAHSRFTPPFVSMTPPCICGPPTLSHRHRRAFVAHPFCHLDITASLRTFAVITGSSLQPPTSSHRHRRALAVHPFVSPTSPRIYGSPTSSLRHRRILAVLYFVSTTTSTHFVSPTLPCTCGSPIVSPTPRICGSFYLVFTTSPPITVLLLSTFRASLAREGVSDYS